MKKLNVIKTNLNVIFNFQAAPIEVGCSADDECPSNLACRSRSCVNPCIQENPCSSSAICSVTNHRPQCKCPPGTDGDPFTQCKPSKQSSWLFFINKGLQSIFAVLNFVNLFYSQKR